MDLLKQVLTALQVVPTWGWAAGTPVVLLMGWMLGRTSRPTSRPLARRAESEMAGLRDLRSSVARLEGENAALSNFFLLLPDFTKEINSRVERRGIAASGSSVARTVRNADTTQGVTFAETTELVEASQDTLDSSLFSEPDGYRPALPRVTGGFDLSKPDTLRNRVVNYWEALVSWTGSLFTF